MQCKYPTSAINKVLQKQQDHQKGTDSKRQIPSGQLTEKKCHVVVPCSQGTVVKVSSPSAENMEYRYILKEEQP